MKAYIRTIKATFEQSKRRLNAFEQSKRRGKTNSKSVSSDFSQHELVPRWKNQTFIVP
jgi:hypothetical protein